MPGGTEWILIILAVLILFGGRKIPEFMRGIGKGIREFNDAKSNVRKEIEEGMNEKDAAKEKAINNSSALISTSSFRCSQPTEFSCVQVRLNTTIPFKSVGWQHHLFGAP